ncbi:CAP domain-containing protein [Deinococcus ruber]|uniref:SCP domain-containing protein n=1 Tax=Deinococcus ruber TaxID=1848197 RepID=A0A918FJB6_9DEIO|nr:CAP domain-containing protein [Deinococcus ruber]GGR42111.1 hypothetical protein GCM10008957_57000 [Deinococcus ruber]
MNAARWGITTLLLTLTACGSVPLPSPTGTGGAPTFEHALMTPLAQQLFALTNTVRTAGVTCQGIAYPPALPLQEDQTLTTAAQHRADDLAATEDFTHTPANGKTYVYWITQVNLRAEFPYTHLGENLGMADTGARMIDVFKTSHTGHCETQFTNTYQDVTTHQWLSGFTRIGIGEAVSPSSHQHYWAVLFAN